MRGREFRKFLEKYHRRLNGGGTRGLTPGPPPNPITGVFDVLKILKSMVFAEGAVLTGLSSLAVDALTAGAAVIGTLFATIIGSTSSPVDSLYARFAFLSSISVSSADGWTQLTGGATKIIVDTLQVTNLIFTGAINYSSIGVGTGVWTAPSTTSPSNLNLTTTGSLTTGALSAGVTNVGSLTSDTTVTAVTATLTNANVANNLVAGTTTLGSTTASDVTTANATVSNNTTTRYLRVSNTLNSYFATIVEAIYFTRPYSGNWYQIGSTFSNASGSDYNLYYPAQCKWVATRGTNSSTGSIYSASNGQAFLSCCTNKINEGLANSFPNAMNLITGYFTAPFAGNYMIFLTIYTTSTANSTWNLINSNPTCYTSGNQCLWYGGTVTAEVVTVSTLQTLRANDTIFVYQIGTGPCTMFYSTQYSRIEIVRM